MTGLQGWLAVGIRAVANPAIVVFERLAQIGVTLVVTLVIARLYGAQSYGTWQIAQSFFVVTSALCLLVPGEVLLPRFKRAPDWPQRSTVIASALTVRGCASVIVLIGYIVAALVAPQQFREAIRIAMLLHCSIAITEPVNTFAAWYLAQSNNVPVTVRRLVALAVRLLVFGTCVATVAHPSLLFIAMAWPLEAIVAGMLVVRLFLVSHPRFVFRFSRDEALSLLRTALPVWWGLLLYALFLKADRLYLANHMDGASFGFYAAAAQLVETAVGMVVLVANTLVPRLIYREKQEDVDTRGAGFFLLLILVSCGTVSGLAPALMRTVFGASFSASAPVLAFGIWLTLAAAIETMLTAMLIKRGAFRAVFIKWTTATLFQYSILVLGYPIVGLWAVLGAYVGGYVIAIGISGSLLFSARRETVPQRPSL